MTMKELFATVKTVNAELDYMQTLPEESAEYAQILADVEAMLDCMFYALRHSRHYMLNHSVTTGHWYIKKL